MEKAKKKFDEDFKKMILDLNQSGQSVEISTGLQLHRFDQRSNGFGLTAGRNDEILTRWNLEKILTNRVRGIDSNPFCAFLLE
ncbi:hypothetical protein [Enterococcus faecium]|uniref:hypothetical protein n=1 Tax=Enterococcus faecium TaxID=1352 RepID=UPI003D0CD3F9